MKVVREEAVTLLEELGVDAQRWGDKRLLKQLGKLQGLIEEDTELEEKSYDLCEKLLKAIDADEEIELVVAKEPTETKPKEESSKPKKNGVIASIKEILSSATEDKPLTKAQIVDKLAKKFPERDPSSMGNTVSVQISRLVKDGTMDIQSTESDSPKHRAYYVGS